MLLGSMQLRERRVGTKSLENKQIYRKPGGFQKQSITKQNKRAEWMMMSSVWSKRRGNCLCASRKCGVASGQHWHPRGSGTAFVWDQPGPSRLLMFVRQLLSSLRNTSHAGHESQYLQLHIHTNRHLHELWGKER